MAADLVLPSTIVDGPANTAAVLMGDLNAITAWLNTNALHIDGTKVLTGRLASPNTDPSSANEFARKAYGDALNTAEAAAQALGDATPPKVGCWVTASSQSVATGTNTGMTFNSELYDTDNFFSGGGSTVITIPAGFTGIYAVQMNVSPVNNGWGVLEAELWVNSVRVRSVNGYVKGDNGLVMLRLTAGDYIQLVVRQDSGSAQNISGGLLVARLSA